MSRFAKYLPALAIVGGFTLVGAQGTDPVPPPAPAASGSATATVNVNLSSADMSATIITTEKQIQDDGRHIMHLKDISTKQKDVIKLTCLNDKLIQYKAQVNIWDSSKGTYQVAATKSDADRQTAYASLMGTAAQIRELRDQANACVGEPELFKQEAGVEVNDPNFPDDPTADDPFQPDVTDIEPPGYASPFY
jgi:hypothetical protein